MVGVEAGREFHFRGDLYYQESVLSREYFPSSINLYSPKIRYSDTETTQHKHKYKQNTKYNDQVHYIIILHQT